MRVRWVGQDCRGLQSCSSRRLTHARAGKDRTAQAVHLHRAGYIHLHHRADGGPAYAHGCFSRYRHSRGRRGVAVQRPVSGRHGRPGDLHLRALPEHHRQRHRTYRVAIVARHGHRQDLLPAWRRYPYRQCPGHGGVTNRAQANATGHHPAADPQLQRLHGADPANGVLQPQPFGSQNSRPGAEQYPPALERPARPGHAHPNGWQATADNPRPRPSSPGRQRLVGPGRGQRPGAAEPDHPGGHRQARPQRIHDPAQQQPQGD
ncbi:hypothetical protein PFLmoz3_05540 [Pseudomonas fluorescens]|uniref:Uncharacterized protein n=1 Tax=Pseudomonas fluorescens TaxID=294 RepID=A0A109LC52_PSEFL|nr:hypothetical protein PFLmoz3_05540 [Pseudomonas fluorescens]